MLLEAGADPDAISENGATSLHSAALMSNDVAVPELLICFGANIDAAAKNGATPLTNAAAYGYLAVVRLLVGSVDVNAGTSKGGTALLHAILKQHRDVVEFLVAAGQT